MSSPGDVDIHLATADDMDDILYGFRTYYWPHEPLSCGYKIKTASPLEEAFFMSIPIKGMSLVATDADRGYKVVGFLTVELLTRQTVKDFEDFVRSQGKDIRLEALKGIYDKLNVNAEMFDKYKVDKVLCLFSLAVDPVMRGKSIGTRLVEKAMSMAESYGCKVIAMDCTSTFSAKIARQTGMESIGEVAYKDHVDESGSQIFNPPEIHTHFRRFIKLV